MKRTIQSCIYFFLFFLYKKISGDSIPLTQKERCPKRYPNLFFEGHFRQGLSHYDVIRMGPQTLQGLCDILWRNGDLQDTQRVTVEEQVAKFLHILSHNVKNRTISFFVCRFGETISCHFRNVLRLIIMLEDQFLQQPDGTQVPLEILQSSRFNPYFKVNISRLYFIFDSILVCVCVCIYILR